MDLIFNQVGSKYEAEFVATADFNLHIEKRGAGYMYIAQRGSETGSYDVAHSFGTADAVIDTDVTALVYPKYIKIVSEVKPTMAEINFAE